MYFYIKTLKVSFSFWFFTLLTFLSMTTESQIILYSIFFILCHELAHILMMIYKQEKIQALHFKIFGVEIVKDRGSFLSYKDEILIYSAGIVLNFILFVLFFSFYLWKKEVSWLFYSIINLVLSLFNALPISLLDGGQILKLCLIRKYGIVKGESKSRKYSYVIGGFFLCISIILFLKGWGNITIVLTLLYLLVKNE